VGSGSGRSLLTRSLQVFSESPPVVGYGGWTGLSRLGAPPPQQQHVRQIGEILQPQHTVSSDEEQQQADQWEEQDEEDFGGFLSSSLPAFHLGFSFVNPWRRLRLQLRLRLQPCAHSPGMCAG